LLQINDDVEYLGYKGYIERITDKFYTITFPSYSKKYFQGEVVSKYFNPVTALVPKSNKIRFVRRNND
jgi:hypothetical protein